MNKIFFLLILMYLNFISAQNDFQIDYGVEYAGFAIDTASIEDPEVKKYFIKSEQESKRSLKPDITLVTLNYFSEENLVKVSLVEIMDADEQSSIKSALPGIIDLKHKLTESIVYYRDGTRKKEFNLNQVDWEITEDYKNIMGYECQRATTKFTPRNGKTKTIEAWFTVAIPIPSGPYMYAGLPGLILEVTNHFNRKIYAREIKFE